MQAPARFAATFTDSTNPHIVLPCEALPARFEAWSRRRERLSLHESCDVDTVKTSIRRRFHD